MKRTLYLTAAVLMTAGLLSAQAAQQAAPQQQPGQPAAKKQPAPKTQAEFEAYQKFWTATDPDEKIKQAEDFLQKYPDSELKTFAYRKETEAYQQKNDFEKMREFAEKVLEAEPNDAISLILLATAIPERTKDTDLDKEQKLNTAEGYAKRALEAIDKLEKPSPQVTDQQWEIARNDARSQALGALGVVNLQRKNYAGAEESLLKAAQLQTQPDPVTWWRLAVTMDNGAVEMSKKNDEAAKVLGKFEEALKAAEKSVSTGGVKAGARDVAVEERDRLKKIVDQRKAAGAPPASTQPPSKPPL